MMHREDSEVVRRARLARRPAALLGTGLALIALAAGCGSDDSGSSDGEGDASNAVIEVIQPGPHPYIEGQNKGFEKAKAELGVDLSIRDSNWDAATADAAVQNAISRGADAIIVHAVESEALAPAIDSANEAGICTVAISVNVGDDQESVYEGMKGFVGWKESVGGRLAGEALAEEMGGEGNVVVMQGVLASTSEKSRVKGAMDVWKKDYPGINVLTTAANDFDVEKARSVMQDLLQRYGDRIEGAFITTNFEAVAAADVIANSPQAGQIPITSNGGWSKFVDYISEGKTAAVVPLAPQDEAVRAVELALECIDGDTEAVYVNDTELPALQPLKGDNYIVNEDNLDKFTPQW
jgi:ribose transport system substrate-binding protein